MIWPWYLAIALTVVGVAGAFWIPDGFIAALVFGIPWFIVVLLAVIISVGRHYNRQECRTFSQQTNRPTRFVIYTTFSWDCLTPDGTGKWIPTKNLREFGSAP